MPCSHVSPYPFLHLTDCPGLGSTREQRSMHVFGGVPTGAPHDDLLALFVPFENGAGRESELPANSCRDGDLTLGGELRLTDRHAIHYQGKEMVHKPS